MLPPLQPADADYIRDFFSRSNFTADTVRQAMGTERLPSRRLRNLPFLLEQTSESSALNCLVRLFLIGVALPEGEARACLPDRAATLLESSGLLRREQGLLTAPFMLAPFEGIWIASDHHFTVEEALVRDGVIPINLTTIFLLRFAVRTPASTCLDLGAGCGVVALEMARSCLRVTATDLNPRAAEFGRFNAALNGLHNVEFRTGDSFEPVAGRTFDRIVCNPPFFITPGSQRMYSENSGELDGFCRALVKRAPMHLNEGGFLQILVEWVELEGQPWQERLAEWFADSGCDAWVLHGAARTPAEYVLERFREVHRVVSAEEDSRIYGEWSEYFRRNHVHAVHTGVICLHRRSGRNWIRFEPMPDTLSAHCGELVRMHFTRVDLLEHSSEESLLAERFRIAGNVRLESRSVCREGQWEPEFAQMLTIDGFLERQALAGDVATFLALFDGSKPLSELVGLLAAQSPAPPDIVRRECLSLVRRLFERGFLVTEPRPQGAHAALSDIITS